MNGGQERLRVHDWLRGGVENFILPEGGEWVIALPTLPSPPKTAFVNEVDFDPLYPDRGKLRVYLSTSYLVDVAREILQNGVVIRASQSESDNQRRAVICSTLVTRTGDPVEERAYFVQRPMSWGPHTLRGKVQGGPVGKLGLYNPLTLQAIQVVIENFPRGRGINERGFRRRIEQGEGIGAWALPELFEEVILPYGTTFEVFPAGVIAPERGPFALFFFVRTEHRSGQRPIPREEKGEGRRVSWLEDSLLLFESSAGKIPEESDTWTRVVIQTLRKRGMWGFMKEVVESGRASAYLVAGEGTVYLDGKRSEWLCVTPESEAYRKRKGDLLGYP